MRMLRKPCFLKAKDAGSEGGQMTAMNVSLSARVKNGYSRLKRGAGLVPLVVWLVAVAGCVFLYSGLYEKPSIVGYAELAKVEVVTPYDGEVSQVYVKPYDMVSANAPLVLLKDGGDNNNEPNIFSPISGQVLKISAGSGELLSQGDKVATLVPIETRRVYGHIPEHYAGTIQVGDTVDVTPLRAGGANRQPILGKVESLSKVIEENPVKHGTGDSRLSRGRTCVVVVGEEFKLTPGEQVEISAVEKQ